jgi:hypothetical protein
MTPFSSVMSLRSIRALWVPMWIYAPEELEVIERVWPETTVRFGKEPEDQPAEYSE